jgi:uncharacterized protein
MALDLDGLQVIDNHCHPFDPERETEDFDQYWTVAMDEVPAKFMRATVLYRMVMGRLKKVLDLAPDAADDEVLAERNKRYRADRRAYLDFLFRDAGIDTLIVDIGYPSEEFTGYSVDPAQFKSLLPVRDVRAIVRIEPIIYRLLKEAPSFSEFEESFHEELVRQTDEYQAVALKSVIAYLTGLGVTPVSRDEAARAYDRLMRDASDTEAEKAVRDRFFLHTVDLCAERDLPLQLHTGAGDSPIMDLRLSNPLSLYDVISDEHYGRIQWVLVHAGYPMIGEVGWLANTYPNVWVDVSEMVPFAGSGIETRLLELFEMAPLTKVMYGSDGYNIPELFWFGARHFKSALGGALGTLVGAGHIDSAFAQYAAQCMCSENARDLYRLGAPGPAAE